MGQRFQSVFIIPSVDMGECNLKPNPNNREEKVLVFHSQWLYGKGALNTNLQIMKRLKKAIRNKKEHGAYAKTKQSYINHFLEKDLINAINWASLQELHREVKFTDYNGGFTYGTKDEIKLSQCLNNQDNNNGFFICEIKEDLNIKYCFISGLEDTEKHEYKKPKEYLELFYSRNDLIKDGSLDAVKKMLNDFKKFERTNKEDFKIIIEEMNQAI